MNHHIAQKKLATLWFCFSGFLILLFIAYTITGRFEEKTGKGWEWLSQSIFPTLTLMAATFYASRRQPPTETPANRFYFRLAYRISWFYLGALVGIVLSASLSRSLIEVFENTKPYLFASQSVISIAIGLFFSNNT